MKKEKRKGGKCEERKHKEDERESKRVKGKILVKEKGFWEVNFGMSQYSGGGGEVAEEGLHSRPNNKLLYVRTFGRINYKYCM